MAKYRSDRYFLHLFLIIPILLSLYRVVFLIIYYQRFAGCTFFEIFQGFVLGLRFDIATSLIVSAPFLLLVFMPFIGRNRLVVKITGILHLLILLPLILWQAADTAYYPYVGRRISYEIFSIFTDLGAIAGMVFKQHSVAFAVLILFLVSFSTCWVKMLMKIVETKESKSGKGEFIRFIILFALIIIGIRGGIQYKPLRVSFAFQNEKTILGHFALNGIYTTMQSIRKQGNQESIFWEPSSSDIKQFREIIGGRESSYLSDNYPLFRTSQPWENGKTNYYNIVVLVMESWSGYLTGSLSGKYQATPVFDALAKDGLFCSKFFATGQRSTEAIVSIVGSIPALPDVQVINSSLEQNRYLFLPQILKKYGYESLFLHGGHRGTMGFDAFIRLAGFDRHISRGDFDNNDKVDDGTWGIWDEFALERLNTELKNMKTPFFSLFFSLSSHDPCVLPPNYIAFYDKKTTNADFLNALHYSDYALGKFFDLAKKEKYFNNTVFVIVADHTDGHFNDISLYERFHIPCLFYAPGIIKKRVNNNTASQMDIMPSIIDLLGMETQYACFGKSIFSERESKYASLNNSPIFGWVENDTILVMNDEDVLGLYNMADDINNNLAKNNEKDVKYFQRRASNFRNMANYIFYYNRLVPADKGGYDR